MFMLAILIVRVCGCDLKHVYLSEPNPSFSPYTVGEMLYRLNHAFENDAFQTVIMVEPDHGARDNQIMMRMLHFCQPLR